MSENTDDLMSGPMLDSAFDAWSRGSQIESGRFFDLGLIGAFFKSLFGLVYVVSFLVLVSTVAVLFVVAIDANEGSFKQHLSVEISAGIVIFLFSPLIIAASGKWKWRAEVATAIAAVALGIGGLVAEGVARLYLIEASVALGLLVVLEIMFRRWQKFIDRAYSGVLDKIRTERESKRVDVPVPFAGSGFSEEINPENNPSNPAEDCE
jgi:hypothetical protein